ncbi:MAG: hypothetical protein GY861_22110 [bacterium]|nr:hypothetical protein [bacterium]
MLIVKEQLGIISVKEVTKDMVIAGVYRGRIYVLCVNTLSACGYCFRAIDGRASQINDKVLITASSFWEYIENFLPVADQVHAFHHIDGYYKWLSNTLREIYKEKK